MRRSRTIAAVGILALMGLFVSLPAGAQESSPSPTEASASDDPVIAAVGDMVCTRGHKEGAERAPQYGKCRYEKVSDIVADGNYDAFLALGDEQYLRGQYANFMRWYDPSYGRVKNITYPIPGNHEYYTPGAAGYYRYFGKRAHGAPGYYSFDLGEWHVVALNSQLCKNKTWYPDTGYVHNLPGWGCHAGSPEYRWLERDLTQHDDAACTMALMHHPMYKWSYWDLRDDHRIQKSLLKLLDAHGADVVLTGHWHNYQRFAPMNPRGHTDPNGAAEFIVGTGGDTYNPPPKNMPEPEGLEFFNDGSYGILQMTLHPDSYDWKFVAAAGEDPVDDAGTAPCH